ncbi:hypothetical protein WICMUC_000124 [Wickerhamomyces mucosus]|uniref:Ubiquitin-like protease family profile domain-containing protein n=1 Tax=Wickerhamomyces mucosus TaxID=1378264 RepID=A0A9P8PYF3_9ASCO|nr:hypothetical protein WICMUC_000124 [Wickerhamomyces mucosus]
MSHSELNRSAIKRKRKINNEFFYSHSKANSRKHSISSSISISKNLTSNEQNIDWTKNSQKKDATESETGSILKFIGGLGSDLIIRSVSLLKQQFRKSDERKDQKPTEQLIVSPLKKRKFTKTDLKVDLKTPSNKILRDTTFLPEFKESYKDVNFINSPLAEMGFDKIIQKSKDTKKGDYGTELKSRSQRIKRKLTSRSPAESTYLREVFTGKYKPPPTKDTSPPISLDRNKSQDNKQLLASIKKVTQNISNHFSPVNHNTPLKCIDSDISIISERKLPPTPSRLTLQFDENKAFFETQYRNLEKELQERKDINEKIKKERLETMKPKSKLIKPVTKEEEQLILEHWKSKGKDSTVVVKAFDIDIRINDLKTLADGQWLNDNIIEVYAKTLNTDKIFAFTPFFFTNLENKGYSGVSKWLKRAKQSIINLDKIIVPININKTHWVMGIIDLKNKSIYYLDSLCKSKSKHGSMSLNLMLEYVKGQASREGVSGLEEGFELFHVLDCPQQQNGYDCGVLSLMNALHYAKDEKLNYAASNAKEFRRIIANTILKLAK